ncbi:MAG TPA: MMPL family transporter [Kofleriaceae bacterium]|nr:MMPL family transporter [Kofleriaceae bacterium]
MRTSQPAEASPIPLDAAHPRALRYARWIDRRRGWILAGSVVVAVACALVAARLPVRSDMASLLPPTVRSVRDLEVLQARARAFGSVFLAVEARDRDVRERAAAALATRLRAIDPALVATVTADEAEARRFFWEHRFLFVSTADLEAARDALRARIARARAEANPLYVDLDDDDPQAAAADHKLDELRARLAEAKAKAANPGAWISKDGTLQLLIVQTAFSSSDAADGHRLLAAIHRAIAATRAEIPGFSVGITGTVTVSVYEHDAVLDGMLLAAAITVILVAAALLLYYRSPFAVGASLWALTVAVMVTFAFTWVAIGQLDLMSAFLTAIVVGNGINAGLVLLARYLDEVRAGGATTDSLARALAGAVRGTLAATLTAVASYASLVVTDFRGFRHFGTIAGFGMFAAWVGTFTVLPAGLCVLARAGRIRAVRPPTLGRVLARLWPGRTTPVILAVAAVTAVATGVAVHYLASDPFLKDWRDLQSDNAPIRATRRLDDRLRAAFGTAMFSGLSNQVVFAADTPAEADLLLALLRTDAARRPPGRELFTELRAASDFVPADQDRRLAVLAELRTLLDSDALQLLSDDERAELAEVRPPDDLRPLTFADVPPILLAPFTEKDGEVGRLILAKGSPRFSTWVVGDRVAFADEVRRLLLPPGVIVGGEPLVIADILKTMSHDGPIVIVLALLGSIVMVIVIVGLGREAAITLACAGAGLVTMIALCAAAGLRVHFLDLIALPLTIGIGVDYAVNLAARHRDQPDLAARPLLATTGAAVLLCSYTTMVGYGSLLFSANGGIRSFGLAAILGEVACISMALALAPALLTRGSRGK